MLTLTQKLPANPQAIVQFTLELTALDRSKSRQRIDTPETSLLIHLPRGTILQDGDLLQPPTGQPLVRIRAKPEPVLTITAKTPLDLLRAAYHLGNRHVPLEITPTYLRLSPDPVLKTMLENLSLNLQEELAPFNPQAGAYGMGHGA